MISQIARSSRTSLLRFRFRAANADERSNDRPQLRRNAAHPREEGKSAGRVGLAHGITWGAHARRPNLQVFHWLAEDRSHPENRDPGKGIGKESSASVSSLYRDRDNEAAADGDS